MFINSYEKDNSVIIVMKGDLTRECETTQFKSLLLNSLKRDSKNIVVDMSDVKYISSSGIALLISGYKLMANSGGDLKLAHISEKVAGIFSLTRLNRIFEIHNSVDSAIKSFHNMIAQ